MGLFSWLRRKSHVHDSVSSTLEVDDDVSVEPFVFSEAEMAGPFTSGNLSMYLIHGSDINTTDFITLEEALAKKKVVIEETGIVQVLRVKNAGDKVVFIQSGDIVKGGRQDRALQHDMILSSKSDFKTIDSFCVEQGRWHQRGAELESSFSTSNFSLSSTRLRFAARRGSQDEIWTEVGKLQRRTAQNAGIAVSEIQDQFSASSLQLTLESEKLQECTEKYISDLNQVIYEKPDVIGCAFAINGKLNSIDIYASSALFRKMSAKLLQAAAVEAFTEQDNAKSFEPPTLANIMDSMNDFSGCKANVVKVNGNAKIVKQESKTSVLYETRDLTNEGQWLHRNYTTKVQSGLQAGGHFRVRC